MPGYSPCRTGLHIVDDRSRTVRNIELGAEQARFVHAAGLVQLARDCGDLDVDLRIDGHLVDTYGLRSESLGRLVELVDEA
jgi:hypothetical protein